jgi:alkylhydroperoxidase/carboxymuconolactone decarboxylase family protein YurZ
MRGLVVAALMALAVPVVVPVVVLAQEQVDPAVGRIVTAMQIGPMLDVMQEEGVTYGEDLAADMLGGQSDRWSAIVARIYDKAAMETAFTARFAQELAGAPELAEIEAFFASEAGQKIVTLEIEARRAMLDEAVEDAAKVLMQDMVAEEDGRLQMLQDFVAAGDLEEQNVVGAMNANFAFMQGMAAAGGPAAQMTEEDMLADVWSREGEVRASTREWLYSYFALAYQPLDDAELQEYTDFWASAAGKRANAALFAAFDQVFTDISRELGRSVAVQMQGDDI